LDAALRAGRLKEQWTLATAPSDIAGLGPFRLAAYRAGEAIVLERNPFYWRADEDGVTLPYLDRLTLAIVRDQNTELLRVRNGQIDIGAREIRPEDYAPLRRDEAQGRVRLTEAGIGLDPNMLWFNLSPAAYAHNPRKAWLQSGAFRRAISHAVNRAAIVDQVFLGTAVPVFGPVTPGNRQWYASGGPQYDYDPMRAGALLDGLDLKVRDGSGVREDRDGRPVRFSVLTSQQDGVRMRTLAVIQEHLRRVGVVMDIVGVDTGMIVQRWSAGDYDAIYFGADATSYDPADNLDFWLSSGSFHLWNAEQKRPATEWEQRIDDLMQRLVVAPDGADRRRMFGEAQRILAAEQPVICFAAPRLVVAMSPRVLNATPAPLKPLVLWNGERLAVNR
jgi:peptide/nickel transport system substrate-binding protein